MTIEGRPPDAGQRRLTLNNMITPGYFNAMSMRLVSGRGVRRARRAHDDGAPRQQRLSGRDRERGVREAVPRGRDGRRSSRRLRRDPGTATPIEIVGVVSDAKYTSVRDEIRPQLFFPILEWDDPRTSSSTCARAPTRRRWCATARAVIHDIDPILPLHDVHTLEQKLDQSLANERLLASLSAVFGLLATLLAMVGLYGVVAYMVTKRTREIGIRMAIGALARDVVWLILRDVVWIVAAGIALALPLAWASTRLVQGQLYGVTPIDPPAIADRGQRAAGRGRDRRLDPRAARSADESNDGPSTRLARKVFTAEIAKRAEKSRRNVLSACSALSAVSVFRRKGPGRAP